METNEEEDFYVAAKAFEDGFYSLSLDTFQRFIKRYPDTEHLAQAQFFIGRCFYYQGKYLDSLSQFQSLLPNPKASRFHDAVLYWIAEVHFKGKDYSKANIFYQRIISEYPDSQFLSSAYYSAGLCLFELEKFNEAVISFRKLVEVFPKHQLISAAIFKIGESLYRDGKYDEAERVFRKFIGDFPKSTKIPEATFFLAEISYYGSDYSQALNFYHKVLELLANNKILEAENLKNLAHTGIGWSYLKLNKIDEAQKEFFNTSESDAILLGRAAVEVNQKQMDGALSSYNRLIDRFPQSPHVLEAFLGKADVLYNLNFFEEAARVYKEAISKFAQLKNYKEFESKVHYGLAWSLLKSGHFSEALKEFEKIARISNDEIIKISALCQMADTYQETKEFRKAIETYDKILSDYPDSLYSDYVQFQIAVTFYKSDRLDAAMIGFKAFLDHFPKSNLKSRAEYYLGLIYFQQANYQAAVDQLNAFSSANKDDALRQDASYLLASSFYNLGQFKQALSGFERVLRENAKKDEKLAEAAEYEIANCLYKLGRDKDAMQRFQVFLRKHPDSKICADILYWIGEYYMSKDNFEIARRYFRKLISDYPQYELADSALYNIATTYLEPERFRAALKAFEQVRGSSNVELSFNAALSMVDIYIAKNEFPEALRIYDELLKEAKYEPYRTLILTKKGDLFKILRDYPQALSCYREALSGLADKNSALEVLFKIAEVEEEKGNLDTALENYLKVSYLATSDADQDLSKRALLRSARICEAENNWKEAKKIYLKLKDSNFPESKFALDRLEWIREHIDHKN